MSKSELTVGMRVLTRARGVRGFAQPHRRADGEGIIVDVSDAHGLCFGVHHDGDPDAVTAYYDPDELTPIDEDPSNESVRNDERLKLVRWCHCGRPWIPALGLYGTTEQVECSTCVLQKTLKRKEAELKLAESRIETMGDRKQDSLRQLGDEIKLLRNDNNERQETIESVMRVLSGALPFFRSSGSARAVATQAAKTIVKQLEQAQILCLQMADWCGFWNSGCASKAAIDQLGVIRDTLHTRGVKW
jgi:hypothetical protein